MATDRQSMRPRSEDRVIVGRERERTRLRDLLDAACDGHGALVLLSGEAGIGKTTLVRDLMQLARERGALVLSGDCYDLTVTPPYGPWSEALQAYQPAGDQFPLPSWVGNPEALREAGGRTALFEGMQRLVADIAAAQPLIMVLEDLHWSDQASLDLLRYLAHRSRTLGLLIIITYRDDELTRRHPFYQQLAVLARETDAERLELQRLDSSAVRELVTRYGLNIGDADQLVAYLEHRAVGNPLFTTELLRALEAEGALRVAAAVATLAELDANLLPAFILPTIERRLARLDPASRHALEIAAVIGQEAPFELWQAISGLQASGLDQAVEMALETHIMEETADHQGPAFTHALVRDVLYQGVIPTRRRLWHR